MIVRNAVWTRIRVEFTDAEKAELTSAIDGEMICPPAMSLDETRIRPALLTKVRDAIGFVAPGA